MKTKDLDKYASVYTFFLSVKNEKIQIFTDSLFFKNLYEIF